MERVFGVGWAKTGTTTLGECLKTLGYDHLSRRLDLVHDLKRNDISRILGLASQKESFEDWPWILLFRQLDDEFPGSKFVLTIRDPTRWIRSYRNMLRIEGEASDELNEIRRILYDLPFPDVTDEQLLERYMRHNGEVKEYFCGRDEDLLIVNWEEGEGWHELCEFLGKDVPDTSFPRANQGRYPGILKNMRSILDKLK